MENYKIRHFCTEVTNNFFLQVKAGVVFQIYWEWAWNREGPCGALGRGSLFCYLFLIGNTLNFHKLPLVPKGRFAQLLIKGEAAKKPPEARLMGPENLINISWPFLEIKRVQALLTLSSCQQSHSWTIAIKLFIRSSQVRTQFSRAGAHWVLFCLTKQKSYSFLLYPKFCLWDSIWH